MSKQVFKLTQAQQDALSDACNPKAFLADGALGTFDMQARVAAVWAEIANEQDLDLASLEVVPGEGVGKIRATKKAE